MAVPGIVLSILFVTKVTPTNVAVSTVTAVAAVTAPGGRYAATTKRDNDRGTNHGSSEHPDAISRHCTLLTRLTES